MTTFDILIYANVGLAIARQLLVAHGMALNWLVAMIMNMTFGVAYYSAGLESGLIFSAVHSVLTIYGGCRWYFRLNRRDSCGR